VQFPQAGFYYRRYLIKTAVAHALERSSDRAKEVLREQADLRLLKDIVKAEQEFGDY